MRLLATRADDRDCDLQALLFSAELGAREGSADQCAHVLATVQRWAREPSWRAFSRVPRALTG